MPSHTCQALVLKTYDVGEADRFAILLTDSCGRIGVRAAGVRRPQSRLMGTVQSLQLLKVRLTSHRDRWTLAGAELIESFRSLREDMQSYRTACRGVELLLRMLEDEEPLPAVFTLAKDFLASCGDPPLLLFEGYCLSLFSLLGLAAQEIPNPKSQIPRKVAWPPRGFTPNKFQIPNPKPPCEESEWISRLRALSLQEQRQLKRECARLLGEHGYVLLSSSSSTSSLSSSSSARTPTCSHSARGS